MTNKKSIAFDMDEVITDTLSKNIQVMNELFQTNFNKSDCIGKKSFDLLNAEQINEFFQKMNTKGYFRDLPIMDKNTIPTLEELNKYYDIYICTAAMEVPNSFEDKYLWLREHVPFLNPRHFIFCGDKRFVGTDYLIDDNLSQIDKITGTGILYSAPHNKYEHGHGLKRVNNWNEIRDYFLSTNECETLPKLHANLPKNELLSI